MRLLIITQAVDSEDPVLGFFMRWVEEFAKHCERIEVICLKEGNYDLPANVRVYSLGKESTKHEARSTKNQITYAIRFIRLIWKLRHDYDAVFVHMNSEYVVLGGLFWKILGKRIVLWYAHRATSLRLRIAAAFADAIVTAALESMRIPNGKTHVVGHGIDTAVFADQPIPEIRRTAPRIVSVGRITPIKNLETLIKAVSLLRNGGIPATADLIGSPSVSSDSAYEKCLRVLVEKSGMGNAVSFLGSRPNSAMPEIYSSYDVSVNLCPTGGLDKTVLESMAAGLPVLVSNEAFKPYLEAYFGRLLFSYRDPVDLARKLKELIESPDLSEMQRALRQKACASADVGGVVSAIMNLLHDTGS